MMNHLLGVAPAASALEIAEWVKGRGAEYLERRQQVLASNEESWRSLSKIAIATATGGPISGVTRVRRDPGVQTAAVPSSATEGASAILANAKPETSRGARFAPWVVAGVSLLATASLLGVLITRTSAGPAIEALARFQAPTTVPVPAPPAPMAPPEVPVVATTTIAAPLVAAKTVRPAVVYAAPARRTFVEPPAPPPVVRAAPVVAPVPAAPAPAGTASPKTDCDPPFYFDGAKKVFKTNCI